MQLTVTNHAIAPDEDGPQFRARLVVEGRAICEASMEEIEYLLGVRQDGRGEAPPTPPGHDHSQGGYCSICYGSPTHSRYPHGTYTYSGYAPGNHPHRGQLYRGPSRNFYGSHSYSSEGSRTYGDYRYEQGR